MAMVTAVLAVGARFRGTDLPIHSGFQHHIAASGEGGVGSTDDGDASGPTSLQVGHDVQQLAGFAAVGEKQADVLRCHDPEITVQGIGGIEEQRHQPDGGEGGGDLASHDAALPTPLITSLALRSAQRSSRVRAASTCSLLSRSAAAAMADASSCRQRVSADNAWIRDDRPIVMHATQ